MKLLKLGVFLSMLLMTPVLEAQNTSVSLWEENIEQLSMDEEEKNWEDELEELSDRLHEPVNINVTTKHELEQFSFLSDIQIENILAYVYIHGQMQTIYELQLVEEMDKHTIDLLLPFVCVHPVAEKKGFPRLKSLLKYGKQEVLTRLDVPFYTRKGYQKNYLGPAMYHSLRYGYRYGDYLQMGITAEKDAGEPFFALHNEKGYDYYSIYFLLRNLGKLKTLALGNYRLSFGQGLVVSTDFRLGKTYSLSTVDNRNSGIRKHSSTDEYNYFRGAAATVAVLLSVTVYLFQQDDIVKENVEVHQAIANILPGRGVPVLYLDDNRQIALNADTLDIEGTRGIEVGKKMITYSKDQIGKEEKYNKIVVPKGGEFHLVLADGSEIWLNAESTLQYFVHDIAKERVVYLQGEAYFKIAKNEQRPFKIISGEHEVKVLGTEFNVNAYLGAPMIYTTLIEGKVNVGVVNRPDIGQVLRENGRQSVYNQNNKSISLRHVDPRIYTAWKDGYFIFRYSTLREVMQQLSRWYDFEYEVPDMLLDKYHFSGEFKRFDNLDRVLEIIRSTGIPFVLDIKNGKVIIREEA